MKWQQCSLKIRDTGKNLSMIWGLHSIKNRRVLKGKLSQKLQHSVPELGKSQEKNSEDNSKTCWSCLKPRIQQLKYLNQTSWLVWRVWKREQCSLSYRNSIRLKNEDTDSLKNSRMRNWLEIPNSNKLLKSQSKILISPLNKPKKS